MKIELPPPEESNEEPRIIVPFGSDGEPIIPPTPEELEEIDAWRTSYQPTEEDCPPEV